MSLRGKITIKHSNYKIYYAAVVNVGIDLYTLQGKYHYKKILGKRSKFEKNFTYVKTTPRCSFAYIFINAKTK